MRGPEVIEMGGNCPCSPKARVSLWRRKGTVAEQGKNMLAALCLRWNQKKTFPWTLVLWGDDIYVVTADVGVQPWLNSDGNFNQVGRRWKSPKQQVPKSVVIRDVCVREGTLCVCLSWAAMIQKLELQEETGQSLPILSSIHAYEPPETLCRRNKLKLRSGSGGGCWGFAMNEVFVRLLWCLQSGTALVQLSLQIHQPWGTSPLETKRSCFQHSQDDEALQCLQNQRLIRMA